MSIDYFSAFVIGLLGSAHCIGMCGGITTMLTSAIDKQSTSNRLQLVLSYNIGRICCYALIGAIAGYTGSLAAKNIGVPLSGLRLIAGVFLILLGLYIGQWLMWLGKIEGIGQHIWKYLSPLSKKLIPIQNIKQAIALGALWGWLPCGLIYSTLTWSVATGNAIQGALIMMSFGLGTLPALVTMSFGYLRIKTLISNTFFKKVMAVALIIYGIFTIIFASKLMF